MLSFKQIISSDPIMVLYHAGCGGEFISKTLAENDPTIHPLNYTVNQINNQWHSVGPVHYSSQWTDFDNVDTWVNKRFENKYTNRRYLFKEHPTDVNLQYYAKYAPQLNVIYLRPTTAQLYFSKLLFLKVSARVETPVTPEYINNHVNDLLSDLQQQRILEWANKYEWVWSHELMICNTRIVQQQGLDNFHHAASLDKYIHDHADQQLIFDKIVDKYKDKFNSFLIVDIDPLTQSSQKFWEHISIAFVNLDTEACIRETDKWIHKNNLLLQEHNDKKL